MKRILGIILFVCSLFSFSALAESTPSTPLAFFSAFTLPEGETVSAFCADQSGGFYLLSTGGLYHWNADQYNQQSLRLDDAHDFCAVCCYQNNLYAITQNHTLMRYDDDSWTNVGQNTLAQSSLFHCGLTGIFNKIFYTCKEVSDTSDDIRLYAFDLSSGKVEEYSAFDGLEIYADETQGCLYHLSSVDSGALYQLDLETGDILKLQDGSLVPSFLNSYYDPVSRCFYVTRREGIYHWDGQSEAELFMEIKKASRIIPLSNGGIVVVDFQGASIYKPEESNHQASSITVMGFQSVYQQRFTMNTGITVNARNQVYDSMMDDIAQILNTRDSSVDIFAIWSDEGFSAIREKGYYTDLSQSSLLTSAVQDFFPKIRDTVQLADGTITAWPFFTYTHLMQENSDLLQAYGFQVPKTFDELLDLIPRIQESHLLEDNDYVLFDTIACNQNDLFRLFIRQYIREAQMKSQLPDFTDERFLHLANRILTEVPKEDPNIRSEDGTESALFMLDCISSHLLEDMHAPLAISANEPAAVEVQLLLLVVNPYSEKKQEALQYLEFLANKHTTEDYALYASMLEPAIDSSIHQQYEAALAALKAEEAIVPNAPDAATHEEKLLALRDQVAWLDAQQTLVSAAAIKQYHTLSSSFVVLMEEDISQSQRMNTLLSQLLDGNLPLASFAESANAYVRMMAAE